MLRNLSEEICEWHGHAEHCAREAAAQSCQKLRQDFMDLEQRWLSLARSYEFTEGLTDFSDEAERKSHKSPDLSGPKHRTAQSRPEQGPWAARQQIWSGCEAAKQIMK